MRDPSIDAATNDWPAHHVIAKSATGVTCHCELTFATAREWADHYRAEQRDLAASIAAHGENCLCAGDRCWLDEVAR